MPHTKVSKFFFCIRNHNTTPPITINPSVANMLNKKGTITSDELGDEKQDLFHKLKVSLSSIQPDVEEQTPKRPST